MDLLLSYGNIPFWGVVVLLFIITTIFALFGSKEDSLFKFTLKVSPFAQIAVRWCVLAVIVLCLFADPFRAEVPVSGRIFFMYVIAILGYILMICVWGVIALILKALHKILMWACNGDSD